MDFVRYFIESAPPFGNISWTMLVVWAVAAAVGIYLLRSYRDKNPIRLRFVRQVGVITTTLSVVGILLLALKFFNVPVLEWRLWSYLVAFGSLGYWGYALYVYNSKLPALIATTRPVRAVRGPTSRTMRASQVNSAVPEPREPRAPRPVATTTRREARRDKKRKSR